MRLFALRPHLPILAAVIAIAAARGVVAAQETARPGVIDGIVTDSSLVPLSDATVSLLGSTIRVVTGANGRFRVRDMKPATYILIVRRIGYEAASLSVQLTAGDTARPSFTLARATTRLDTVTVKGQQLTPAMQEFEARRKFGEGQFMTQAEIEKRNVVGLSDLLSTFKGIVVNGAIYPKRSTGAHGGPQCQLQVYIDGVMMPAMKADEYALPKEIAGIEVYVGPATIPVQYKSSSRGGFCGVILLWTRVGT
jgi:hypothetical protein